MSLLFLLELGDAGSCESDCLQMLKMASNTPGTKGRLCKSSILRLRENRHCEFFKHEQMLGASFVQTLMDIKWFCSFQGERPRGDEGTKCGSCKLLLSLSSRASIYLLSNLTVLQFGVIPKLMTPGFVFGFFAPSVTGLVLSFNRIRPD